MRPSKFEDCSHRISIEADGDIYEGEFIYGFGEEGDIYELLPAFLCAGIVIVIVSLLTPAPEQEVIKEFENI